MLTERLETDDWLDLVALTERLETEDWLDLVTLTDSELSELLVWLIEILLDVFVTETEIESDKELFDCTELELDDFVIEMLIDDEDFVTDRLTEELVFVTETEL